MKKVKKAFSFSEICKKSLIISQLIRFSNFISKKFSESYFKRLLCGCPGKKDAGVVSHLPEKLRFKQKISIPFKRFMARSIEKSFIINRLHDLIIKIPDLQVKTIGAFSFAFGLYISVSNLIRQYALNPKGSYYSYIYFGLVCAIIGGVLSSSSKKLSEAVLESKILSFLIFTVLGIKKTALEGSDKSYGRNDISFLLGISAGALSAFFSPYKMTALIIIAVFAYAILSVPKCGVICIILALPFLRIRYCAILCAYVTICWLLKLMRGKRTLQIKSLDIAVIAFTATLFFGGLISVTPNESMKSALLYICFISGYFLTVNLIKTSEWIMRCAKAVVFSLSASAIAGLIEYFVLTSGYKFFTSDMLFMLPGISNKAFSLFVNPSSFADLILLTLPFLFAFFSISRKGDMRIGFALLSFVSLLCLVFTWSRGGLIAMAAGIVLLLILSTKKAFAIIIPSLLLIPTIPAFLPKSVSEKLFNFFTISDSSVIFRNQIQTGVDRLLSRTFVGGIGFGESSFKKIYPLFSINPLQHTHSLYTQLIVYLGITGLIVFIAVLLIFLRNFSSHYSSYSEINSQYAQNTNEEKHFKVFSAAGFTGIFSVLIHGLIDYVWYSSTIFLLFWIIMGLTSATMRTAASERVSIEPKGISLDLKIIRSPNK